MLFGREQPREVDALVYPGWQGGARAKAGLTDIHVPPEVAASEIHGAGVLANQGGLVPVRSHADHELVSDDAATGVAAYEKRQPAEHPLFGEVSPTR